MRDAADVVTDFIPGSDTIDLTALLASIGVAKPNAISGGYVRVINGPGGAVVQIDADGTAGPGAARPLVTLTGVAAALIDPVRDLGL